MKITFVSNFMNHHQLPFSKKMMQLTNNNYTFIALEPISNERINLGYEDMNDLDFVIKAYDSDILYKKALDKILNDDVVIFGSCPNELISIRMKENKFSILYTERFFKKGTYRRFIPITYYKIYNRILKYQGKNIKILCSSAYAPYDFKLLKCSIPIYKWGYFAETKVHDIRELINYKKNDVINIVWVGRLIKFKHVEDSIEAVIKLIKQGYNIRFNIIGKGILEDKLRNKILTENMEEKIHLLGAMSPEKVREYMEKSNIFLFNSDFNEGWGSVLNEAMNSGCAVIASHAAGAVPFLIQNEKNGLIYQSGNIEQLYQKLKYLIDNRDVCEMLGVSAYETIINEWNANIATERLYRMIQTWTNNNEVYKKYKTGPCSPADIIDHNWFK